MLASSRSWHVLMGGNFLYEGGPAGKFPMGAGGALTPWGDSTRVVLLRFGLYLYF